jgi:hypothetical protein
MDEQFASRRIVVAVPDRTATEHGLNGHVEAAVASEQ